MQLQLALPDLRDVPRQGASEHVFECCENKTYRSGSGVFLVDGPQSCYLSHAPISSGPSSFHRQVPSGFLLADAMIQLDSLMEGALLKPGGGDNETKVDVAIAEAKRLKRLMGGLRHLYRNCFMAELLQDMSAWSGFELQYPNQVSEGGKY